MDYRRVLQIVTSEIFTSDCLSKMNSISTKYLRQLMKALLTNFTIHHFFVLI